VQINTIDFVEDGSLQRKETVLYCEKGSLRVNVSPELCSKALIQLNDNYGASSGSGGYGGQYQPKKKATMAGSTRNVFNAPSGGGGPPKFGGPPQNPYNSAKTNAGKVNVPPVFGGGAVKPPSAPVFGGGGGGPPAFGGATRGKSNSIARSVPRAPPKKFQPPPPPKKTATVLYDYAATDGGELTITEGEIVTITKEDDSGWWEAKNEGNQTGLIPANYVTKN